MLAYIPESRGSLLASRLKTCFAVLPGQLYLRESLAYSYISPRDRRAFRRTPYSRQHVETSPGVQHTLESSPLSLEQRRATKRGVDTSSSPSTRSNCGFACSAPARSARNSSAPASVASSLRDLITGTIYKHGVILYVQQKRGDGDGEIRRVRLPRRQLPDVAVSRASGQAEPAGVL